MNAILKKDNVFIYVEDVSDETRTDPSFILEKGQYGSARLFEGRVILEGHNNSTGCLFVDGIKIYNANEETVCLTESLHFVTIVAYLNQMETWGVDAFLEKYRKALIEFKDSILTLKRMCTETRSFVATQIEKILLGLSLKILNLSMLVSDQE